MHSRYFPICTVPGPIEPPVPFGHMCSHGAVPYKCSTCPNLFEGECIRNTEITGTYSHLDHGPCGIPGPTDPVVYEDRYIVSNVEIPRKCSKCTFLAVNPIHGFHCTKDKEKWGDFFRGLDWGAWSPDTIYIELPPPKVTTRKLSDCLNRNDLVSFITEHRRINPSLSMDEAKSDFAKLRKKLEAATNKPMHPSGGSAAS
jgi:hypothetical protein